MRGILNPAKGAMGLRGGEDSTGIRGGGGGEIGGEMDGCGGDGFYHGDVD